MKDLYYILMYNNLGNVKECKTLIKHGLIQVNGVVETNCKRKIQEEDVLIYQGKMLKSQPFHYLMLNKPQGYLCANKDEKEKCVVDLIDYPDCFCLGRLDRDTTGLLILTNDKSLKKLLLPQNHVEKTYLVETKERLNKEDQEAFKRGIIIDQKIQCLPAKLEIITSTQVRLEIVEGKYHQVKRMFAAVGNRVVKLHRLNFAGFDVEDLKEGEYKFIEL